MQLCDAAGLSFQVVLTKIDKLAPPARVAIAEAVAAELARYSAAHPEIHLTSAEKGLCIAALRATVAGFAEADQRTSAAGSSRQARGRLGLLGTSIAAAPGSPHGWCRVLVRLLRRHMR